MKGSTLMRPLIFDFAYDETALNQQNEYMFGRALLINPVTEAGATQWKTYLPKNRGGWYNYATSTHHESGTSIDAPVTRASIPVFVKAGSILPIGADRQSSAQQVDEKMTLRVYPGNDAEFTLYEDEGTNYHYEQGQFTTIRMTWNDAKRTLTLAARQGAYKGMLNTRTFQVVLPDGTQKTVTYSGKKVTVKF